MTWLKPGGYRKFMLIVSEYIVQSTAARITLVPVKNSSIDQKTLLAVTNAAVRPLIYLTRERLDRSRWRWVVASCSGTRSGNGGDYFSR